MASVTLSTICKLLPLVVYSTAQLRSQLHQGNPHRAVPVACNIESISEQPGKAPRSAHAVVRPYRAHIVLCEHPDIDVDARPPTRLGLPRWLWD